MSNKSKNTQQKETAEKAVITHKRKDGEVVKAHGEKFNAFNVLAPKTKGKKVISKEISPEVDAKVRKLAKAGGFDDLGETRYYYKANRMQIWPYVNTCLLMLPIKYKEAVEKAKLEHTERWGYITFEKFDYNNTEKFAKIAQIVK